MTAKHGKAQRGEPTPVGKAYLVLIGEVAREEFGMSYDELPLSGKQRDLVMEKAMTRAKALGPEELQEAATKFAQQYDILFGPAFRRT